MSAHAESVAPPAGTFPPVATMLLMSVMLSTGAAGLVMEYVLATVSTYILGNSIEQFSIVIAVMFLTMGGASFLQKFVGDDYLVEKFVLVEVTLALLGGFSPLIIYGAFAYVPSHFSFVLFATVAAIGFLIGFEIPLIIRLNQRYVGELKANLGWVLSMDYVGGFVGALIWVKYLLVRVPLTEISFIVAGCNFAMGVVLLAYFTRAGAASYVRLSWAAAAVTVALLLYGWSNNHAWSVSIEQQLYEDPIIHAETSKYQRVVLTHDSASDDYRLYLNGGLQLSSLDEARYHEHLVHPAMVLVPKRDRVLILGGGDGFALREVLKYQDVREVVLVDIDPAIIALAREHPVLRRLNGGAFDDARVLVSASAAVSPGGWRDVHVEKPFTSGQKSSHEKQKVAHVRVLTIDAFTFVSSIKDGPWDVIIVDFPDPDSVELAKLYSREFYRSLRTILAPHGVVAQQATSPYHAKEAFLCIGRTAADAGFAATPTRFNVPSFGDWGVYLYTQRPVEWTKQKLRTLGELPVPTVYLTPDLVHASLAFGQNELTARHHEVSTVMRPVILQYYVAEAWNKGS